MNIRYQRSIAVFVFLLLAISSFAAQTITGKVVGVTDGDTIKVLQNNSVYKIRLNGIDCPEKSQAFGNNAKQFTSNMVFGKTVTVQVTDIDRYGRNVGIVRTQDGKCLNNELVKAGFAWWYQQYAPGDTNLQNLERQARNAKRGLWSDKNPVAPWDFRHGESSSSGSRNSYENKSKPISSQNNSQTVYITRTGECYHNDGCSSLSRSKIPINLKDAITKGYRPCKRCH